MSSMSSNKTTRYSNLQSLGKKTKNARNVRNTVMLRDMVVDLDDEIIPDDPENSIVLEENTAELGRQTLRPLNQAITHISKNGHDFHIIYVKYPERCGRKRCGDICFGLLKEANFKCSKCGMIIHQRCMLEFLEHIGVKKYISF